MHMGCYDPHRHAPPQGKGPPPCVGHSRQTQTEPRVESHLVSGVVCQSVFVTERHNNDQTPYGQSVRTSRSMRGVTVAVWLMQHSRTMPWSRAEHSAVSVIPLCLAMCWWEVRWGCVLQELVIRWVSAVVAAAFSEVSTAVVLPYTLTLYPEAHQLIAATHWCTFSLLQHISLMQH